MISWNVVSWYFDCKSICFSYINDNWTRVPINWVRSRLRSSSQSDLENIFFWKMSTCSFYKSHDIDEWFGLGHLSPLSFQFCMIDTSNMLKNSDKSVSLWNLSASYMIYALNRSRNNIFLIDLVYITRQQKYWIQWKYVLTYLQYRGRRCTWGQRPWGWSPSSSSYNASTDNILTSFSLDYAVHRKQDGHHFHNFAHTKHCCGSK